MSVQKILDLTHEERPVQPRQRRDPNFLSRPSVKEPMMRTATDEVELMRRIKHRDQSALLELYQRFHRLIFSMAMQVLRNQSIAEDVTQDVFFQVWRWPEKWDPTRGRLTSWLLSVTRYTAIDHLRRESRQPSEPLTTDMPAHSDRAAREDLNHDNLHHLKALLAQLPVEQRQIIYLAYFRGMTHSQIADFLKLPLGTVKSRLRIGLEKLKKGWLESNQQPVSIT